MGRQISRVFRGQRRDVHGVRKSNAARLGSAQSSQQGNCKDVLRAWNRGFHPRRALTSGILAISDMECSASLVMANIVGVFPVLVTSCGVGRRLQGHAGQESTEQSTGVDSLRLVRSEARAVALHRPHNIDTSHHGNKLDFS